MLQNLPPHNEVNVEMFCSISAALNLMDKRKNPYSRNNSTTFFLLYFCERYKDSLGDSLGFDSVAMATAAPSENFNWNFHCLSRAATWTKKSRRSKSIKRKREEEWKKRKSEVESRFMPPTPTPSDSADIYSRYKMQIPNENLVAS